MKLEVESARQTYDSHWWKKVEDGIMTRDELRLEAGRSWNVVRELQVHLRAVK